MERPPAPSCSSSYIPRSKWPLCSLADQLVALQDSTRRRAQPVTVPHRVVRNHYPDLPAKVYDPIIKGWYWIEYHRTRSTQEGVPSWRIGIWSRDLSSETENKSESKPLLLVLSTYVHLCFTSYACRDCTYIVWNMFANYKSLYERICLHFEFRLGRRRGHEPLCPQRRI